MICTKYYRIWWLLLIRDGRVGQQIVHLKLRLITIMFIFKLLLMCDLFLCHTVRNQIDVSQSILLLSTCIPSATYVFMPRNECFRGI